MNNKNVQQPERRITNEILRIKGFMQLIFVGIIRYPTKFKRMESSVFPVTQGFERSRIKVTRKKTVLTP